MDLFGKILGGLFILWAGAMVVGLVISLMPLILAVAGFFLMIVVVTLVGRLVGSWIGY